MLRTGKVLPVLVVSMVFAFVAAVAQPKANSPFSRLGIGDIEDRSFVPAYAMGSIGAVYYHPYNTNLVNPASLAFLESTSLEAAVAGRYASMEKDDFSQNVWSGNLEYLSLSLPLINPLNNLIDRRTTKYAGALNISLAPYSQVGYFVLSSGDVEEVGDVESLFRGSGGTARLNIGTGWKYGRIAGGVNIGYLFGNIEYEGQTIFNDLGNNYDHVQRTNFSLRGFVYDLGVIYEHPLGKAQRGNDRFVAAGAHFNTTTNFSGTRDFLNFAANPIYQDSDTAAYEVDVPLEGQLPGQFGIGLMYTERSRLQAGITYSWQGWGSYENNAQPQSDLRDSWQVSAGASFTPNLASITSYLQRIEYRAGAYYKTDPRVLDGIQMTEYGFSFGIGLPFIQPRFFSYIDLGFEYGWRGVEDSLKENYLRFRVGLNLNDTQWFLKRRFN